MCRAAAGKDGAKGRKKKGAKRIYSHLTAKEHAWYLAKQGTHRGPQFLSCACHLFGSSPQV